MFDLSHTIALCYTIESGGPNSSTSSVVMPSCACKGRDYPAFSLKSQRCLSGACTGCRGDQKEWFALHQPLSPKLSMMGGPSQTHPSMDSSWTSGHNNTELLYGNPSSNLYWVKRVILRVRIGFAQRDAVQGLWSHAKGEKDPPCSPWHRRRRRVRCNLPVPLCRQHLPCSPTCSARLGAARWFVAPREPS